MEIADSAMACGFLSAIGGRNRERCASLQGCGLKAEPLRICLQTVLAQIGRRQLAGSVGFADGFVCLDFYKAYDRGRSFPRAGPAQKAQHVSPEHQPFLLWR
jgi:hypothetical protein